MKAAGTILGLLVAVACGWALLGLAGVTSFSPLGFNRVVAESASDSPTGERETFSYEPFQRVLGDVVEHDSVNYHALANQPDIEPFVASLAEHGPETTPALFEGEDEAFAYYLNAYNALVLYGVREHWPIESVRDVQGWAEPREGFGFFYGLKFAVDGKRMNLYDLEHRVIRERFADARLHAALNCASTSCPALHDEVYRGETLDETLDEVTRKWLERDDAVHVNEAEGVIRLNAIFDWYREDFVRDAEREGWGDSPLDWISQFVKPQSRDQLSRAREAGYDVSFLEYDWSLNNTTENDE